MDIQDNRKEILSRITSYFGNGGLFNPEAMEHDKVRDLLRDVQKYLKYPKPSYTADVLLFSSAVVGAPPYDILLIQRKNNPFKDHWAFPGGFVNEGETAEEAAKRELKEETSVDLDAIGVHLYPLGVFDKPGRDPRGWVISAAFCAYVAIDQLEDCPPKAKDDAKNLGFVSVASQLTNPGFKLAFDHQHILEYCIKLDNLLTMDWPNIGDHPIL